MAAGQLVTYQAGEVIWTPTSAKEKAAAACAPLTRSRLSSCKPLYSSAQSTANVMFQDLIQASPP